MRVRFWGTRGSLAKPGPTTLRYGGNTSCVEVRTADGTLIVLDCGTGAHGLGWRSRAPASAPLRGHLLITHTHWDHIQGFPFFAPLFVPGNEWDIYAPGGLGQQLEATLAGQMEYTYFPVTLAQCGATIRFHDLTEGSFEIGPVRVVAQYLNHPALTLGYRLEAGGAVARVRRRPRATRARSRRPGRRDRRRAARRTGRTSATSSSSPAPTSSSTTRSTRLEEYPQSVELGPHARRVGGGLRAGGAGPGAWPCSITIRSGTTRRSTGSWRHAAGARAGGSLDRLRGGRGAGGRAGRGAAGVARRRAGPRRRRPRRSLVRQRGPRRS